MTARGVASCSFTVCSGVPVQGENKSVQAALDRWLHYRGAMQWYHLCQGGLVPLSRLPDKASTKDRVHCIDHLHMRSELAR